MQHCRGCGCCDLSGQLQLEWARSWVKGRTVPAGPGHFQPPWSGEGVHRHDHAPAGTQGGPRTTIGPGNWYFQGPAGQTRHQSAKFHVRCSPPALLVQMAGGPHLVLQHARGRWPGQAWPVWGERLPDYRALQAYRHRYHPSCWPSQQASSSGTSNPTILAARRQQFLPLRISSPSGNLAWILRSQCCRCPACSSNVLPEHHQIP